MLPEWFLSAISPIPQNGIRTLNLAESNKNRPGECSKNKIDYNKNVHTLQNIELKQLGDIRLDTKKRSGTIQKMSVL